MAHHQQHQNPMSPSGTTDSPAYYQQQEQPHAEKGTESYAGQHGTYQDHSQHQQYPNGHGAAAGGYYPQEHSGHPATAAAAAPTRSSTIAGMKRGVFFCVVALIALLLALVIGLGAGLGVSQRNLKHAQTDLAAASASLASAAPAATETVLPTATQPTATPTPTANAIECPAKNGTSYTTSGSNKQFIKYCGRDYGKGEADDLGSVTTSTFDQCIDACSTKEGCQGAGWGVLDGDKNDEHSCWMKTNITSQSHNATAEWHFALLVPPTGSSVRLF